MSYVYKYMSGESVVRLETHEWEECHTSGNMSGESTIQFQSLGAPGESRGGSSS